jgi:NAD(P)H-dependent FMN reductase
MRHPTPAKAARIAILSTSTEDDSRSRALALAYRTQVEAHGGTVDFIDLKDVRIPLYGQGSIQKHMPLIERFNAADG